MQLFQRNAEAKLVEALNSVTDPKGWKAVHFHLSDLMDQFKSEYQIKIAVNLINDLLKNFDGGIFVLQDSSIILVCYGLEKTLQNKLVFQLRYLYMDDPLAYTDDGQENPAFYTDYDLQEDWQDFMELSTRRMAMTMRRPTSARAEKIAAAIAEKMDSKMETETASVTSISARENLTVTRLANLERELQHLGIGNIIRNQSICAIQTGLPVRKMFDELYMHMSHLSTVLKADIDFFSNRWLFRYLTQLLDMRMLDFLKNERDRYLTQPVSINMNTETLLSDRFQEFDRSLSPAIKKGIVLEVPLVDAFVDMAGFNIARREMQALGYRVCLDGVTTDSLNHIQRDKLGVDLIKVQWNAVVMESGLQRQDLIKAVSANGPSRVILCRCDKKQAIDFGQSIGIALFQGRYVDSVLNPTHNADN
ncbi:MAG: hypothetical protein SFX19_08825 [Alphaproteobacteria bacterium]|nr:hypothetical protein [Alphaproteobacteria bacterium]